MSDGYEYIVEMVDKISGPAKTAQQQIAGMVSKLEESAGALAKQRSALVALDAAGGADVATRARIVDSIKKQESALQGTAAQIRKSVEEQKKATGQGLDFTKAADAIKTGEQTIGAAFKGIGDAARALASGDAKGAVQGLTDSVASMAKLLDLAVPGLGQAVSAVISIAGGLVGITVGLIQSGAEFALASSAAKREMLGMFDAMGGGITTGLATEAMIDGLKAKTGVLKDELVGYTKSLMALGITDLSTLEDSVTAMASANALMGKEGVGAFSALKAKIEQATTAGVGLKMADKQMAKLYETGVNVDDIASQMGISAKELRNQLNAGTADAAKFGFALEDALVKKGKGPLDLMTSGLPYLKKQFMESMGDIFEDIEVAPFLASVKDLFSIFSQSSGAGQSLKAGIGGFFNQVFATATKVVPYIKSFLLDLVIYGLRAYLALKPIVKTIIEFATSATAITIITTVLSSLWEVVKVVGAAILVVVVAFGILWVAVIAIEVAFWTLIGAIVGFLSGASLALVDWIGSAAGAAYDFVAGLVGGIANGASAVIGAVTGLADSATNAFKSALGIASPSKVMMEMGGHTTDGFAAGVEDGTADTQGALAAAVTPPGPAGLGAPAGSGGGGGPSVSVTVNAAPGMDLAALAELVAEKVAIALEEISMQMGGAHG